MNVFSKTNIRLLAYLINLVLPYFSTAKWRNSRKSPARPAAVKSKSLQNKLKSMWTRTSKPTVFCPKETIQRFILACAFNLLCTSDLKFYRRQNVKTCTDADGWRVVAISIKTRSNRKSINFVCKKIDRSSSEEGKQWWQLCLMWSIFNFKPAIATAMANRERADVKQSVFCS